MSPRLLKGCDMAHDVSSGDERTVSPVETVGSWNESHHGYSRLQAAEPDGIHDLICVGFGPASLAIAVALHDSLEAGTVPTAAGAPKVLFLEKQAAFSWHAGMLLPGAKMQISFIKDLATLRDPRSNFTFVNYLHSQGRLVEFTNLGTFLPSRSEYEDYMRWAARHFDNVVRYGHEVTAVSPDIGESGDKVQPLTTFTVTSRDGFTGTVKTFRARNVLIAIGGQPSLPACLPTNNPRVVHSSQYAHLVPKILSNPQAPYRIAIVGGGQSASEIFHNIHVLYPNSKSWLVMKSEFLRPSDDSPFVNSIFNPGFIDWLYPRSSNYRERLMQDARSTNYSVVRLELIEKLYETMYDQRRELGIDERKWQHRIMGGRQLLGVQSDPSDEGLDGTLRLRVRQTVDNEHAVDSDQTTDVDEILDVDLIVSATGYKRTAHRDLLKSLLQLKTSKPTNSDFPVKIRQVPVARENRELGVKDGELEVGRNYQVTFPGIEVAAGSGVWLQGCCEGTHGLSDTLLSVLATRSGEIVSSIFGSLPRDFKKRKHFD